MIKSFKVFESSNDISEIENLSDILTDDELDFTIHPPNDRKPYRYGERNPHPSLAKMIMVDIDIYKSRESSFIKSVNPLPFRIVPHPCLDQDEIDIINRLNQLDKTLRRIFTMTKYKLMFYELHSRNGFECLSLYLDK